MGANVMDHVCAPCSDDMSGIIYGQNLKKNHSLGQLFNKEYDSFSIDILFQMVYIVPGPTPKLWTTLVLLTLELSDIIYGQNFKNQLLQLKVYYSLKIQKIF